MFFADFNFVGWFIFKINRSNGSPSILFRPINEKLGNVVVLWNFQIILSKEDFFFL